MQNNATLGMTAQKMICDKFSLIPYPGAEEQFNAGYDDYYAAKLADVIDKIFAIMRPPIQCLTFSPSIRPNETFSPHNFLLDDASTLSIRTNKKGDKIAPRVVGQCGIAKFNEHFRDILGYDIEEKSQIKSAIFENIHLMLPVFLDYMFPSDYTVWIQELDEKCEFEIFDGRTIPNIEYDRSLFSFTKNLNEWNESTTLKYKGVSIAEIQIHKNRTFKFRFIMSGLEKFLIEQTINTETVGITAEKTICDMFELDYPDSFRIRYSKMLERELRPALRNAFRNIPKPIKHTGSTTGIRGGTSKCSYDFELVGGLELSLKTSQKMICPPEVGQPGAETCYQYFREYIDGDEVTERNFKEMVLSHIAEIMPIYVQYLFESDYMLWVYKRNEIFTYSIFPHNYADDFVWESEKFSFSKPTVEEWNESNSVRYDGIPLGEFQVHHSRVCYKFRFNMENLITILGK